MFDAAKTCRTCMKTDVNLVSLFDPWNANGNSDFHVADALVEVTKTQVRPNLYSFTIFLINNNTATCKLYLRTECFFNGNFIGLCIVSFS